MTFLVAVMLGEGLQEASRHRGAARAPLCEIDHGLALESPVWSDHKSPVSMRAYVFIIF